MLLKIYIYIIVQIYSVFLRGVMKKQKQQKQQKQKTKKEDLQEYVLSNYVGKNFVWSHLVTMPSITLMKSIHNTLWNTKKHVKKDKELTQDLLNIDKLFFQILHLLYYYVTMGKDETVMVQYSVHTAVTLLTEIINQLPINDSNHAERPLHAYDKMLQLEKQLKYITTSTAALPEKINLVLTNMLEYLENQFVVLDRVFSAVYLRYNECADFIDKKHSVDKPKLKLIYDIITKFIENMKDLQAKYPEHNFERLLIEEREDIVANVFVTPEKSSAKINASVDRSFIPDATPKSITDDVEASAKFIKQVLDKHSMISISPIIVKKPRIVSRDSIMDLDDPFYRTGGGFMIDSQQQIVSPVFGENNGEEDNTFDDESIAFSSTTSSNSSSSSESDDDESSVSKFFAQQPKQKKRRELFA